MRLPNIPRRGRGDRKSRGQSLVEFALVLPLILMLTLIALDFGRVYLGWINLQSMARIGANLAANNPTAWSGSGDAAIKARYQAQIKNDATANNCRLPVVGGVQTAPAPTFTGQDLGDEAAGGAHLHVRDHHPGHLQHPGRVGCRLVFGGLPRQDRHDRH